MAAAYTWPLSLPQAPLREGFGFNKAARIKSTPMDLGTPKTRYAGKMPRQFTVSFNLTLAQIATLDDFIENTIKYTRRFNFPDPLNSGAVIEACIVSDDSGLVYSSTPSGLGKYLVTMQLRQVL